MPVFSDLERSEALRSLIKDEIKQLGAISFERFMMLALYHPIFGYYCSPHMQIGEKGDFTTAPQLSPLFARCLARQFKELFGLVEASNILELGAGSGQFAADTLNALETIHGLPTHYFIYEASPALKLQQQKLFAEHYPQHQSIVAWLDELPKGFKGIIFANEVLDALPFRCFQIEEISIKERCVNLINGELGWELSEPRDEPFLQSVKLLKEQYHLQNGYQSEINLIASSFIQSLAACLDEGVILFADYGYGQQLYYHPERNRGTMTCFYQHQRTDNPFAHPGRQDITAHVDFTRIIETASGAGMSLLGFTTQASFLLSCGLITLATEEESLLSEREKFALHQAIKQLTLPTEMGETIKIMGLAKNLALPTLLGFKGHDRRRDL